MKDSLDAHKAQLGQLVPDRRVHAFSEQTKIVKLKDLVREALKKERMEGNVDIWGRPERHPTHPEYTPEVEDQTEGDDKPEVQPKFKKELPVGAKKEDGKAKAIKLSGLVPMKALDQIRDKKSEKPKEIEEKQFEKDEHEGKVNDDDKQGLPLDMYKVDEIRFKSIVSKMISESDAGEEAEKLGLVHKGWGKFADPKTGQVTHKSQDGRLVPVGQGGEPQTSPAGVTPPAGGGAPPAETPGAADAPPGGPAGATAQTTSPTGGRATGVTALDRSIGSANPDRYKGAYAIKSAQEDLMDLGFEKNKVKDHYRSWKDESGTRVALSGNKWIVAGPDHDNSQLPFHTEDTAEMIDYVQDMKTQIPPEEEDEFSSELPQDVRQQF